MEVEGGALVCAAFVKAQAEMEQPHKDREVEVQMRKADGSPGGKYKFKYATLGNTISTIRPALAAADLGFTQRIKGGEMVTRIVHSSGEFLECGLPMPTLPAKPQDAGAVISYFRRFSLTTALGIVADEDDEKNVAIENDAAPGPAWPDGPYTSKSGIKAAWKACVHDLRGAGSLQEVEDIIEREQPMLAQFRAAARNGVDDLKSQYHGGGDFKGVADELMNARSRFAGTQDVPLEPGRPAGLPDEEVPETVVRSLLAINECATLAALKAWNATNADFTATLDDEHRTTLRKAYAARSKAITADTTAAG